MHGELPGAASAFLSVASRVEVAAFFRYLREDVSQVDDDDLQAVFQLAFRHLPVLAHRALGRAMSAKPEPMGSLVDKLLELRILGAADPTTRMEDKRPLWPGSFSRGPSQGSTVANVGHRPNGKKNPFVPLDMGRYGAYAPHTVEYQIYRGEATHSCRHWKIICRIRQMVSEI